MTKLTFAISCLYAVVGVAPAVGKINYSSTADGGALGLSNGPRLHAEFKEPVSAGWRTPSLSRRHRTEGSAAARNIAAGLRVRGGFSGEGVSGVAVEAPIFANKVEDDVHQEDPHGDMSVATAILNIVADLCPHGMLPVAYGMAAVGGTGLVVAPALLAAFGVVSAYTMVSIGRACQRTKRWSFGGLWTDLVGKESAWAVELAVAMMTFGCCIFYLAFAGDLFSALAGSASFMPTFLKKRAVDLVVLALCPLLPLCLMKNLSALQYTSFIGVVSILYTVCFVVGRSLDGSYSEGGDFFRTIDAKFRSPVRAPWDAVKLWRVGPGIVTLMNMSCVAFMCHYNGVKYYEELENRSVKKYTVTIG